MSEMSRAVELGCYFSVKRDMLRSVRHRKLVASIPTDRILTETDGRFVEDSGIPLRPRNVDRTVNQLSEALMMNSEAVRSTILNNLRVLLT